MQQARRSKSGASSAAHQARRSKRGAASAAQGRWQARQQSSSLCAAANAAAWALVHACHGAGGSEGTRLLLAGQVRAQEGRQATRARGALRRGQCWIRWNVGRAAGVQAQSAQGMGAQKRGAAPPLGSGKARGVGVRRRGAARGVAAQHRGSSGPREGHVECTRAKENAKENACGAGRVDCRDHQSHESYSPWSLKQPGQSY